MKVSHDVDDGEFEEERVEEARSSTNSSILKWFGKGGKTHPV